MKRSSIQALLELMIYNQKTIRHVALATAREAVAESLVDATVDIQRLSREVEEKLSTVGDPGSLIDDASGALDRTWSAARIRAELDALHTLISMGDGGGSQPVDIAFVSHFPDGVPEDVVIGTVVGQFEEQ